MRLTRQYGEANKYGDVERPIEAERDADRRYGRTTGVCFVHHTRHTQIVQVSVHRQVAHAAGERAYWFGGLVRPPAMQRHLTQVHIGATQLQRPVHIQEMVGADRWRQVHTFIQRAIVYFQLDILEEEIRQNLRLIASPRWMRLGLIRRAGRG